MSTFRLVCAQLMPRQPRKFNPLPFPYHHELELEIETLTNLGLGLGRVELSCEKPALTNPSRDKALAQASTENEATNQASHPRSWVVMVRGALPGERIRARVFRNYANYSEADLLEVLQPSPQRIEPICPLFGSCGGCQYQNLAYPAQLEWKRQQVSELLERLAGFPHIPVEPTVPSPREYGYRSKLTPHFDKPRPNPDSPDPAKPQIGAIGFLRAGTRRNLIDVPQCPIAMEAINEQLPALRSQIQANASNYRKGATLLLRSAKNEAGEDQCYQDPKEQIQEIVEGIKLRFLASDFFQNNPFILPHFTAHAREEASATQLPNLIDAYCGSGLFALTLARSFKSVTGIELSETAILQARANAELNGIQNAHFTQGSAEAIFQNIHYSGEQTAVLIDPPRKGASVEFLDQLIAFAPARIVYISCNPATQMRDLAHLHKGGYSPTRVTPFDLFPQTRHIECVVTLEKNLS